MQAVGAGDGQEKRVFKDGWRSEIGPRGQKGAEESEDRGGSREEGLSPRQWAPHAALRPGAESRPQVTMPANLGPLAPGGLLRVLKAKGQSNIPTTWASPSRWSGAVLGQEALSKLNQGQ